MKKDEKKALKQSDKATTFDLVVNRIRSFLCVLGYAAIYLVVIVVFMPNIPEWFSRLNNDHRLTVLSMLGTIILSIYKRLHDGKEEAMKYQEVYSEIYDLLKEINESSFLNSSIQERTDKIYKLTVGLPNAYRNRQIREMCGKIKSGNYTIAKAYVESMLKELENYSDRYHNLYQYFLMMDEPYHDKIRRLRLELLSK